MYPTKEQQTTGLEPEMANFREFGSIDESLQGYDTFLRTGKYDDGSPRYDKALAAPTGPQYIQELKNAGYASDDSYVKLVTDVHNQYFPSE
jgi:flagellum-specific peptidoglycan hydrolase FlgJ